MIKKLALVAIVATVLSADINKIETLSANFVQKIVNNGQSSIVYSGKMYAKKKKNQTLWIYKKPIEKYIYYRDGSIVVIEPELEQATFAKLDKVPNILSLIRKAKRVSKTKLKTKFNGTTYDIDVKGDKILKVKYLDEMQNRVTISFKNELINQNISDNKFIYQIPAGYDILEQQ